MQGAASPISSVLMRPLCELLRTPDGLGSHAKCGLPRPRVRSRGLGPSMETLVKEGGSPEDAYIYIPELGFWEEMVVVLL